MTRKPVDYQLVFIVGVGRSGTSLLQAMFAAHPLVSCLPETAFLRRYVATGTLQSAFEAGGEAAIIDILQKDEVFARTGLDAAELLSKVLPASGSLDAAIYKELVSSYAGEGKWVGDKDPRLIEFLPLVKALFPHAHIINIVRDPRDVLASKKKAAWSRGGHVWKHVFANRVQLAMGRRNGPQLFGDNYHEIIYEELITSPKAVLTNLCEQLEMPFDEPMLSFGKAAKNLISKSEMSWKKETLGPLLKGNKGKWKGALAPREIILTETCCHKEMNLHRYSPDHRFHKLSLIDRLWVSVGAITIKTLTHPYKFFRIRMVGRTCKRLK